MPVEDALRRAVDWFQAHGYIEDASQVATVSA
jgi:hypothetical protein